MEVVVLPRSRWQRVPVSIEAPVGPVLVMVQTNQDLGLGLIRLQGLILNQGLDPKPVLSPESEQGPLLSQEWFLPAPALLLSSQPAQ